MTDLLTSLNQYSLPEHILEQIKLLPSSNSLVLQGVGHMGMLEATDQVNQFMQQFIETA